MLHEPREMIAQLVAFDTTSRDSNMALIDFVRDYLAGHGIASRLIPNADGSKANLYASVGPQGSGGVILSGHSDVVPVDGQPWDTDPFHLVEMNGRLYGRGTADMKSFLAIALALVPEMLAAPLKYPIHLAFSYDEEVGCLGAPSMIADMAQNLPPVRCCIIGEPTSMEIVNAHKGIVGCDTEVIGHEAHSSQIHRGVSAVMTAARLIGHIDDMMAENAANADPGSPFAPPYTTLHVGRVDGGSARNIISRHCRFEWDIRNIPDDDPLSFVARHEEFGRQLLPPLQAIAPHAAIRTTTHVVPSLVPEPNGEAERLCRHLTGRNDTGVVSYVTEAGQFREAGFSTVVCGPGSIDVAHQPNEYISLDQVNQGVAFQRKLISHLCQ